MEGEPLELVEANENTEDGEVHSKTIYNVGEEEEDLNGEEEEK